MTDRSTLQRLRSDLSNLRMAVAGHRTERERATNAVAAVNAQLAALDARIAAQIAGGDRNGAEEARQARAPLLEQRAQGFARIRELDDNVRDAIGRLHGRIDPCDADPVAPLLLLPVRLETRYTEDRRALRVRIFPDDIHIDALDRGMTATEQVAALAYWTAVWRASDDDAATA